MITNIGSIVNINGRERALVCSFTEHMDLHFDIHMSFKKYEETGDGINLDSLTILTTPMLHIIGGVVG